MPSNKTKFNIYIAVHKGAPVDMSKYRHTALWCIPQNDSSDYYFHVQGLPSEFTFEARKDFDPTTSRSFAKSVGIGRTRHSLTSSELCELMRSVPVENSNPEFNCQQWVQYALNVLYQTGYLTEAQYNAGVYGMVDAIAEAEDEDLAYV